MSWGSAVLVRGSRGAGAGLARRLGRLLPLAQLFAAGMGRLSLQLCARTDYCGSKISQRFQKCLRGPRLQLARLTGRAVRLYAAGTIKKLELDIRLFSHFLRVAKGHGDRW